MKELRGKNAILTGASRGLGVHIARTLAEEGVNVALAARSVDALEKVRDTLLSLGVKVIIVPTDLTEPNQVEELVQKAEQKLGSVDILVNNAGVEFAAPYEEYPSGKIQSAVRVNLLAPMLLAQAVLPGMLKQGFGHIVNMSSLAGKLGVSQQAPYATTKAGLIMFTHSLRSELLEQPVGASVICPGFVEGDGMYSRFKQEARAAPILLKPTTIAKVTKAVPKVIRQDIAELVVNPLPIKPLVVLRGLLPGSMPFIHKVLGVKKFFAELSAYHSDK